MGKWCGVELLAAVAVVVNGFLRDIERSMRDGCKVGDSTGASRLRRRGRVGEEGEANRLRGDVTSNTR